MKVIQVIPNLYMGGAEIMCETLTLELVRNGVEVKIVSLYNYETPISQRLTQAGIEIVFLDKKRGMDLSIIKKLKKIFEQEKPDVVHSHLNAQKYTMIAAKQAAVPMRVHTVHSVADKELSKIDKILAKRFYKKQRVIPIALSELIQQTIVNVYGISPASAPIILNGINLTNCLPKYDYSIGDTIKLLHIGRFSEEKNHKGLIDAFKIFHSFKPNSVLELIGNGNTFEEIKKYVVDQDLEGAVSFLGMQTNVYQYINAADIFILPSLYEGIPMTLIEAMGTGIPIVATNVGGIPNMLSNNESALLTSVDSQEIADSLIRLSEDVRLRKKIGQNALERSQEFSSREMARQYIKIYQGGNQ
jgi:glycosyltransferase involved in cell wall biosynthesis